MAGIGRKFNSSATSNSSAMPQIPPDNMPPSSAMRKTEARSVQVHLSCDWNSGFAPLLVLPSHPPQKPATDSLRLNITHWTPPLPVDMFPGGLEHRSSLRRPSASAVSLGPRPRQVVASCVCFEKDMRTVLGGGSRGKPKENRAVGVCFKVGPPKLVTFLLAFPSKHHQKREP